MYTIEKIKPENYRKIKEIYEDFRQKALRDYKYENQPIEFDNFISVIQGKTLDGLVLIEDSRPTGILIYSPENYKVIEINTIHTIYDENENKRRFALLEEFLRQLQSNSWETISYAMLGRQDTFVRDIALLGFKLVGQSIIKYDFQSPVSFRIFKNSKVPALNQHKLSIWDDKFKNEVIELTHLSFKNTKNAKFDPRFLTYKGSENVLNKILSDQYGKFLSSQTRILLLDGKVEGYCLATMVAEDKINIPLIATRKDSRNKGMGKLLLKSVLSGFIKLIEEKKIYLSEINATADTDNYPAIKMYRRLGFKEDYFYPHAYLNNSNT